MKQKKVYEYKKLVLLPETKIHEKIFALLFKFFGYGVGSLTCIPMMIMYNSYITPDAFSEQSVTYEEHGETIFRRKEAKDSLFDDFMGYKTVSDLIIGILKKGGNKALLGYRDIIKEHIHVDAAGTKTLLELGPYKWLKSDEVYRRILTAYEYLKSLNLNNDRKLAIFAETSQDWLIIAIAAILLKAVIVTVFTTLTDDNIIYAFTVTQPAAIFVDTKTSARVKHMLDKIPSVETLIYSSRVSKESLDVIDIPNVKNIHIDTIYTMQVKENEVTNSFEKSSHQDTILIMYTSGTTGQPKGVLITQGNVIAAIAGSKTLESYYRNQTCIAYLPLAHVLELMVEFAILAYGGSIGYANPGTLFPNGPFLHPSSINDIAALKPSVMVCVPMILERAHKTIMTKFKELSRFKKILIQEAYNLRAYFHSRGYSTPILSRFIFKKFREIFGGRLELCIVGGAYLSPELEEFFNIIALPFKQAYGTTEIACGGMMSNISYHPANNIGPPLGCSDIKLLPSEDDGNYDKTTGIIRGEILVSGPSVSPGYYNDQEKTNAAFTTDSNTGKIWYHTSDIGEYLPDGTFRIVGRKSDIIKLSHGEFVRLNKVETVISICKYADYVCCVANRNKNGLLAIVAVNHSFTIELGISLGHEGVEVEKLVELSDVHKEITDLIETELKKADLTKYEIPKSIILTTDIWTIESGLLTSTLKIRRSQIAAKYSCKEN